MSESGAGPAEVRLSQLSSARGPALHSRIRRIRPTGSTLLDGLLLLLLAASLLALFPYGSIGGDQARDLRIAADIVAGVEFPLTGPLLAGLFHLGPVWYYFLAMLHGLGLDAYGIHLVIALLAALQFPLVYLCARQWRASAGMGIIWAALLLVPSWGFYEQVFPGHTSLTGVATTAMLLFSVRLVKRARPIDVYLVALAATLALHAHPTVLLLLPIPLACTLLAVTRARLALWHLAAALILPLALLLPALIAGNWSLADSLAHYWASDQGQGRLSQVGPLAWQLTGAPLQYWLAEIAGWSSQASLVLAVAWASLLAMGLAGAGFLAWNGDHVARIFLATLAFALLGLALGRAIFPYYMFGGVRILVLALAAAGLSLCLRTRLGPTIILSGCLGLYWVVASSAIEHLKQGSWPFAFVPLFAVTSERDQPAPLALSTSRGLRQGGQWLCSEAPLVMHGSWAQMLVISLAMESRLSCGLDGLQLGGSRPGASHWIGLSAALVDGLDREAHDVAGPWRLFPVREVVKATVPINVPADVPDPPRPPLPLPQGDAQSFMFTLPGHDDAHLAISNLAFGIASPPVLELTCGDQHKTAAASDSVTTLFSMHCEQPLSLQVTTQALEYVDVVVF